MDALRKAGPMVRHTRYLWIPTLAFERKYQIARQVYSRRHLHKERIFDEGIVMHLNPSDISNDFEDDASNHTHQETPCAIFDTTDDLDQEQ